jgi:hypothetical protein
VSEVELGIQERTADGGVEAQVMDIVGRVLESFLGFFRLFFHLFFLLIWSD